jgi:hypothetical protein
VHVAGDQAPDTNGANLLAAMDAITDAGATKPYVISLAPGTYRLPHGETLRMKSNVSVVGAGRGITTIDGWTINSLGGLVALGDNTTLARVTVSNLERLVVPGTMVGVSATGVVARVADVASRGRGIDNGIGLLVLGGAHVDAERSSFAGESFRSSGIGIFATEQSVVRATGVVASGVRAPGLRAGDGATIAFTHGVVAGGAFREPLGGAVRIAHSQVDGGTSGGVTCFSVHDAAYAAVTCS